MDRLRLMIEVSEYQGSEIVHLYINDRNFIEMLKEYEAPFAGNIAGEYEGLCPDHVFLPSRHLLGEPIELLEYDGKAAVLECECGCPGCWPFLVKITVEEDIVMWSDFEQPHRGPESAGGHWKYDKFGPFIFDRKQYESELFRK